MSKNVYQIDPVTREFVGVATAFENPMAKLDGIPFNIPASCVEEEPPATRDGFAIVREGNVWTHVVDYRGKIAYATADKTLIRITDLGPVPDGYTLSEPGPYSKWVKNKWVNDEDAKAAAEKATNNAPILAALQNVDTQSIRSIREWLAAQPSAPQFIKDHEKTAQEQRKKLQK
jgi:hypothetical protein